MSVDDLGRTEYQRARDTVLTDVEDWHDAIEKDEKVRAEYALIRLNNAVRVLRREEAKVEARAMIALDGRDGAAGPRCDVSVYPDGRCILDAGHEVHLGRRPGWVPDDPEDQHKW